jgi:hypothetical protein
MIRHCTVNYQQAYDSPPVIAVNLGACCIRPCFAHTTPPLQGRRSIATAGTLIRDFFSLTTTKRSRLSQRYSKLILFLFWPQIISFVLQKDEMIYHWFIRNLLCIILKCIFAIISSPCAAISITSNTQRLMPHTLCAVYIYRILTF